MITQPTTPRPFLSEVPRPEDLRRRTLSTPIGELTLIGADEVVTQILLPSPSGAPAKTTVPMGLGQLEAPLTELREYFCGERRAFTMRLAPSGTPFQRLVWAALQGIPYGETRTYGQIAFAIGHPSASRAVGGANNKNPLPIVVPCHRVIGSNGSLVGYAGGLAQKEVLLAIEGVSTKG